MASGNFGSNGSASNRSIFALEPGKIILGTIDSITSGGGANVEDYSGSFIWLEKNEMYFGSLGNITFNSNNLKIQTKYLENNTGDGGANIAANATKV